MRFTAEDEAYARRLRITLHASRDLRREKLIAVAVLLGCFLAGMAMAKAWTCLP